MSDPTSPRIFVAQNTEGARRKVAAQVRLYSDAKVWLNARLALIAALALVSAVAALLAANEARTVIGAGGGVLLLIFSFVGANIEKRQRSLAVAVQEEFDTDIFRLPWNSIELNRPSPLIIAKAAARYRGGREKDWYSDTEGTHRPFDVLICQSSNLGWGATTHRIWSWILAAFLAVLVGLGALVALTLDLSGDDILVAFVVPGLAFLKEVIEQMRANFETARAKEAAEAKISTAWAEGMSGKQIPTEETLRLIQNKIMSFRQQNPYVPDWFDKKLHARNEHAMGATAADRVAEAARCGHGEPMQAEKP
ncbi:MAG: hypothetical protein QOC93_403 [Actinomycetota bacterium]|jgi:hypothetical protein|nr:hypothetical protein [Actinomycetota bacterium]